MSARPLALVLLSSLLAACDEEPPPEPEPLAELCPLTGPALLVPAPAAWLAETEPNFASVSFIGDWITYAFLDHARAGDTHAVPRCGGEPTLVLQHDLGYTQPSSIDSDEGLLLYAIDDYQIPTLVDRLDVPGLDEPRRVLGIPEVLTGERVDSLVLSLGDTPRDGVVYVRFPRSSDGPRSFGAAGLDAERRTAWLHRGDMDRSAELLGEDIVSYRRVPDGVVLHHDDGRVRRIDGRTGAAELLVEGARHIEVFERPGSSPLLLWQVLGDDASEPVRARDLASGEERELTVNDFAAQSWGRDFHRTNAGFWIRSADDEQAVFALVGVGGRLVRAFRADTLEELEVPANLRGHAYFGESLHFGLLLSSVNGEEVRALWEPLTGAVREWYRGPEEALAWLERRVGDRVEYQLENADGSARLLSVDLDTGEVTTLLPRVDRYRGPLADGRYLGEHFGPGGGVQLADPATGVYQTLLPPNTSWRLVPDFGVVYLDRKAEPPGLYAIPIPPRSP